MTSSSPVNINILSRWVCLLDILINDRTSFCLSLKCSCTLQSLMKSTLRWILSNEEKAERFEENWGLKDSVIRILSHWWHYFSWRIYIITAYEFPRIQDNLFTDDLKQSECYSLVYGSLGAPEGAVLCCKQLLMSSLTAQLVARTGWDLPNWGKLEEGTSTALSSLPKL